jgi:dihydrolipoamide dehydrogenase
MLAHKGTQEGITVAEAIAQGKEIAIKRSNIPWVIYTAPEIAWVGRTEQDLRSAGIGVRVGVFPFAASVRAGAMDDTEGLVKIVADENTDQILGVHIIGPWASELIAEAVLAIEFSASSEDLARTIHAYPSLAEALHGVALDNVMGREERKQRGIRGRAKNIARGMKFSYPVLLSSFIALIGPYRVSFVLETRYGLRR